MECIDASPGVNDAYDTFAPGMHNSIREAAPTKPRGKGPCPFCGRRTERRTGRHGDFFGCVGFPMCRGTREA